MVTYRASESPFVTRFYRSCLTTDNSLVIVVSPLVSLMVDQVRSLRSRSVKASMMFCTTLTPRRSSILGETRCFATVGPKIATATLASTAA